MMVVGLCLEGVSELSETVGLIGCLDEGQLYYCLNPQSNVFIESLMNNQ